MTKAALTIWENRISPVYDSASSILIIDFEDQQIVNKTIEPFNAEQTLQLVRGLVERNISYFICGAIAQFPAELFLSRGIRLIPFVTGNLDDILTNLVCGNPIVPQFLMPGCRRKNCSRRQNQLNQRQRAQNFNRFNHQRKNFRRCCS